MTRLIENGPTLVRMAKAGFPPPAVHSAIPGFDLRQVGRELLEETTDGAGRVKD